MQTLININFIVSFLLFNFSLQFIVLDIRLLRLNMKHYLKI